MVSPLLPGRRRISLSSFPSDRQKIELDLDQLDFLDASGVRLLLDLAQRSRRNGRRLRIKPGNSPQVRRVLELTGVVEHLPLEA